MQIIDSQYFSFFAVSKAGSFDSYGYATLKEFYIESQALTSHFDTCY